MCIRDRFKDSIDRYKVWVIAYTKQLGTPMMFYTAAINGVWGPPHQGAHGPGCGCVPSEADEGRPPEQAVPDGG